MRVWFPGDLFYIDGGWQGLRLIAPIDLVLGPTLTLILYRPWKKSLAFDMSTIALVQILALGYGIHSAYQQRTAAIVFEYKGHFETISLSELKETNLALAAMDLEPTTVGELGKMPAVVHAGTYENLGLYLEDILNGKPALRKRTDRYVPIAEAIDDISKHRVQTGEDGEIIEVPASAQNTPDGKNLNQFKLQARYGNAIITLQDNGYEIRRIGH